MTNPRLSSDEFPDCVPTLVDPAAGVQLRAHRRSDVPGLVEQCRDPEMIRWTLVPTPAGGYAETDALAFLELVRTGWNNAGPYGWAIELIPTVPIPAAGSDKPPVGFAGSISLVPHDDGSAEVAFGLHPAARGRRAMSAALRLVRDYGFDVLGYPVLRWHALAGNWGSRRAAAAAGFQFDGVHRAGLNHRGTLQDGWVATMLDTDPRIDLGWSQPPLLTGDRVRLRPLAEGDLERVIEACSDPQTQHWLSGLPDPYGAAEAAAYLESTRELAATQAAWTWCVTAAGPATADRCLAVVSLDGLAGPARRLEIGYWAHPDARGQGVVAAAVRLVRSHLAAANSIRLDTGEPPLADSVSIHCAAGNIASRRVAVAAGFTETGIERASEPLGDGTLDDLIQYACRP